MDETIDRTFLVSALMVKHDFSKGGTLRRLPWRQALAGTEQHRNCVLVGARAEISIGSPPAWLNAHWIHPWRDLHRLCKLFLFLGVPEPLWMYARSSASARTTFSVESSALTGDCMFSSISQPLIVRLFKSAQVQENIARSLPTCAGLQSAFAAPTDGLVSNNREPVPLKSQSWLMSLDHFGLNHRTGGCGFFRVSPSFARNR